MQKRCYCRQRDLPKLIGVWPKDLEDRSPSALKRRVAKLEAALRSERRRGLAGHWTYDLARHTQLLVAFRSERTAMFQAMKLKSGLDQIMAADAKPYRL